MQDRAQPLCLTDGDGGQYTVQHRRFHGTSTHAEVAEAVAIAREQAAAAMFNVCEGSEALVLDLQPLRAIERLGTGPRQHGRDDW